MDQEKQENNPSGYEKTKEAQRDKIHSEENLVSVELHITPHMFRHTFATSLLEADVNIRYIQEMLGHSSINITEIYTHVLLMTLEQNHISKVFFITHIYIQNHLRNSNSATIP